MTGDTVNLFCTSVIPTVNRPTLARAVSSILDQEFAGGEFEVIVVNDSGQPLPSLDWQRSPRVRLVETNRRERCAARNTGAALAHGKYLHFMDDDDWLMPRAWQRFWELSRLSQTEWLYGGYDVVNNRGDVLEEIRPMLQGNVFSLMLSGESIPLGASLIGADLFFRAGGFDPTLPGVEDRDLGRRLALLSDIAGTTGLVARFRVGPVGSTTNWSRVAESDRRGREKAMRELGAIARIRASDRSGYWRGRVSRVFLSSAVWNLRRGAISVAASRAAAGLTLGGAQIFAREYWRGLAPTRRPTRRIDPDDVVGETVN